ncbi:MAG: DUF2946 family protein [Panacagrimonas sp.]
MFRRTLPSLLFIASLLFGAWMSAQHGPEHVGTAAHHDVCAICVLAGSNGAGPPSAAFQPDLEPGAAPPPVTERFDVARERRSTSRARGPPVVLA